MDFINRTDLPADLMVGSTGDREMLCILASKVTYRIEGQTLERVGEDEAWPIFDKPFEFQGLQLAPDLDYRKTGTDVLLFGQAVAPRREPVEAMWVTVQSGSLSYRAAVYGDRVWVRSGRRLVPSQPVPFAEMPLGKERAFGGVGVYEGQEMPHPINPDGIGFYLSEEQAEGHPLPNIERPDQIIGTWQDRPTPACLLPPVGPMDLSQEGLQGGDPLERIAASIGPSFNQAVPELVVDPHDLGDVLHLEGFSEQGPLDLPMPPRTGPEAVAFVGDLASRFPSVLSTLVVLVPERVCIATYVSLFRYLFRPREKRYVELRPAEAPATAGKSSGGAR